MLIRTGTCSPLLGRKTSPYRIAPSRIAIGTSFSTIIVPPSARATSSCVVVNMLIDFHVVFFDDAAPLVRLGLDECGELFRRRAEAHRKLPLRKRAFAVELLHRGDGHRVKFVHDRLRRTCRRKETVPVEAADAGKTRF